MNDASPAVRTFKVSFILTAMVFFYSGFMAESIAASKIWDGGSGNWSDSNWSGGGVPPVAGDDVVVNAGTVLASASSVAQGLNSIVINGGTVSFLPNYAGGSSQDLVVNGNIEVNGGVLIVAGRIDSSTTGKGVQFSCSNFEVGVGAVVHSDGKGFIPGMKGPGAPGSGRGASHGGYGYNFYGGRYGDADQPVTLGSGTANDSGGGALKVLASNSATVNGEIRCNAGSFGSRSGSGGSIWIVCDTFHGSGLLEAKGGSNDANGGGGRLAVDWNSSDYTGAYNVRGGTFGVSKPGKSGTLSLPEGAGLALNVAPGHGVGFEYGVHQFGDVVVDLMAEMYFYGDPISGVGSVLKVGSLDVKAQGVVSAEAAGFGNGKGPANGGNGQGAGHGGRGANNNDPAYGNVVNPIASGSGGSIARGGGAIKIDAGTGSINVAGTLTVEGQGGNSRSGAGGSIWLNCGSLTGDGTIKARGGSGTDRGGGGGRVALHYGSSTFSGTVDAKGGATGGEVGSVLPGNLQLSDHSNGAATDDFDDTPGTKLNRELYKFNLFTDGNTDDSTFEAMEVTSLVFDLDRVGGLKPSDFSNIELFLDSNGDGSSLDEAGSLTASSTSISIVGIKGTLTLTFNAGILVLDDASNVKDLILQADVAQVDVGDKLTIVLDLKASKLSARGTALGVAPSETNAGVGSAELRGGVVAVQHVIPGNAAPVGLDDTFTILEDAVLNVTAPGVLGNDADADLDGLQAQLLSGPSNGTLTLNTNGSFSYDPNTNFVGTDVFTYAPFDGIVQGNTVSVTIMVDTVNDPPNANPDTFQIENDATLTIAAPGLLSNDTDPENDTLTAVLVSAPGNGTLTLNADGSFSYTSNAGFQGSDSFSYAANDGIFSSTPALVTIQVFPGLNANPSGTPLVVVAGETSTLSGNPVGGSGTYVSFNWSGPNGFASTIKDPGTVVLPSAGIYTYTLTVIDSLGFSDTGAVTIAALGSGLQPNPSASPNLIQQGDSTILTSNPTGGSGVYVAYTWTGPNGYASSQQNPGAVRPQLPGPNTYTVTVTDASGLVASDSVTVLVGLPMPGLAIDQGGVRYKVDSESRSEKPVDSVKIVMKGLDLLPGDRIAVMLNGISIGDLSKNDGLTLDGKLRASGQLGSAPNLFTNCRARYQKKKRKLIFVAKKGVAARSGQPMVLAASGTAPAVMVVVLIDRAPADGTIDVAAMLPVKFSVKVNVSSTGRVLERGRARKR